MKIYLVGGAVRDQILGISVKERDWVVVGATVEDMRRLGYRPVGKDFPVFLHPETHEEYALARTERKVGRGYAGFNFNAAPDVTLIEDLKRRDLTINAIAQTAEGEIIDPYHGVTDIQQKLLRHVSPAFIEDPVRILRVARFAARYANLNFTVAPETLTLMKQMVQNGEVDALVPERVWKELERALMEKTPQMFFQVLAASDALNVLFPSINSAAVNALAKAAAQSEDSQVRFAVLMAQNSEQQIQDFCAHYRAPTDYRELALLVARHLKLYQQAHNATAAEILFLLQSVDALRRESRFKKFLLAAAVLSSNDATAWLLECYAAMKTVNVSDLVATGVSGKELAEQISQKRIAALELLRRA